MQAIQDFFASYWVHMIVIVVGGAISSRIVSWIHDSVHDKVIAKLEELRVASNSNPVLAQLKIDDAIINIMESYIPEVLHELEDTAKSQLATGNFSAIKWKELGVSLWAKARAELEAGTVDYLKTSGEKDGEVLAELIAKKYIMKQAAITRGLIKPN